MTAMKLRVTNRKKLLKRFNEHNCTDHPASRYIGVRVGQNRDKLVFLHWNGEGRSVMFRNDIPDHWFRENLVTEE